MDFPSPVKPGMPRNPHTVYKKMQLILERSGAKGYAFTTCATHLQQPPLQTVWM